MHDDNYDDFTFQVHETFDDLGLGNHSDSNTTGHAGARLSCCVIAVDGGAGGAGGAGGGGGSSAALPLVNYTMVVTFALMTCVFALLRLD